MWRPGSGARRGLRAEGGVRATPLSRRAGRDSGFRAGIRAQRMAGPSGGTERRQPSGSQAAGGAGAPRFAPGPPPPLFRARCARLGETETPWGARWVRPSGTSRFRGCSGSPRGGPAGRGGLARIWGPGWIEVVGCRQGAPLPGPLTDRKASPGSCETNAAKPGTRGPGAPPLPTQGRPPEGPRRPRARGQRPAVRWGPPGVPAQRAGELGSREAVRLGGWQGAWVRENFTPRQTKTRVFTLRANWCGVGAWEN